MRAFAGVMVALACLSAPHAQADNPIILKVVDNSIPDPLTSQPGDPAEGRKVMLDRRLGNCVSCHQVSALREADFQGDIGPSLGGVGKLYTTAQLRLILANPKLMFPGAVMPAFHVNTGLNRVLPEYAGKPILTAQQVEDVIAFLKTLD
jgi:L-cysteine S-thiosulfotransferase